MTAMKDFASLPFSPAPTMVGVFKEAAVAGWEDITEYYGEADYGLSQTFKRDNVVLKINWEAGGNHIAGLRVVAGEDTVFLDCLSPAQYLSQRVGELFFTTKSEYGFASMHNVF